MGRETVCVTGGCGFVGHHFVEHVLRETDWRVVVVDSLGHASSGFDRLRETGAFDAGPDRFAVFTHDFVRGVGDDLAREIGGVDWLVHMAAETHVDRSIEDPGRFVEANVVGTMNVLEWARGLAGLRRMVYFSTDEVFGPAPAGVSYLEWDRYDSRNPYAASKAGGEELCLAWANTYGVPVFVTHTMNVFGERQWVEKFIPKVLRSVLDGLVVPIHASVGLDAAGSRHWIHARNVAAAVLFLLSRGEVREKYNIVGEREVDNLSLAQQLATLAGGELRYEMVDYHSSRPGHDLRYALCGSRMADMGWRLPRSFDESLAKTVEWTLAHRDKWL